jgi:hypothetical protein
MSTAERYKAKGRPPHFFLEYINENQSLQEFIYDVEKIPGHQSTVIRLSNAFLEFYQVSKQFHGLSIDEIARIVYLYTRRAERFYPFQQLYPLPFPFTYDDFNKVGFEEITRQGENFLEWFEVRPIDLVISLFNDADISPFEDLKKRYNKDKSFNIKIEKHGRSTPLNSKSPFMPLFGGISIGIENDNKNFGTLGGFLKDLNGPQIYGITCQHVVGQTGNNIVQPSMIDGNSRIIGKVDFVSELSYCLPNEPCNNGTNSNNIDVALIEINKDEVCVNVINELGLVTHIKPFNEIMQTMKVEFNGRSTNTRKELIVGGLCLSHKVVYEVEGQIRHVCFTNLNELQSDSYSIFGHNISSKPVLPGDSGSWICSSDSKGYGWCGLLISGGIDRGYFLAAEKVVNWLNSEGYSLDIPY